MSGRCTRKIVAAAGGGLGILARPGRPPGGAWPSGKATGFGPVIPGSNPGAPAPAPTTPSTDMTTPPLACVILAAGRGTRMKSDTPKLLHPACGRPVLEWTLRRDRAARAGPHRRGRARRRRRAAGRSFPRASRRSPRSGRWAPATRPAAPAPRSPASTGDILVMNGDHPLTDPASLRDLAAERAAAAAAARRVLTFTRTGDDRRRLRPHRPRPLGRGRADRRAARHDAAAARPRRGQLRHLPVPVGAAVAGARAAGHGATTRASCT